MVTKKKRRRRRRRKRKKQDKEGQKEKTEGTMKLRIEPSTISNVPV